MTTTRLIDRVLKRSVIYTPNKRAYPDLPDEQVDRMRLINTALLAHLTDPDQDPLDRVVCVDIEDVMIYAAEQWNKGVREPVDLPSMLPPWRSAWLEGTMGYLDGNGNITRGKCAVVAHTFTRDRLSERIWEAGNFHPNAMYIMDLLLYVEIKDSAGGPVAVCQVALDADGNCIEVASAKGEDFELFLQFADDWEATKRSWVKDSTPNNNIKLAIISAMWALAFINCKNVTVEPIEVPPKVRQKRTKKLGRPPMRMSRIRIDGLDRTSRGGSGKGGTDLRGEHIVRGHFAHYGDCCPGRHAPKGKLFGKHTGRYVVPMHVRGNRDEGVVISEYKVTEREDVS